LARDGHAGKVADRATDAESNDGQELAADDFAALRGAGAQGFECASFLLASAEIDRRIEGTGECADEDDKRQELCPECRLLATHRSNVFFLDSEGSSNLNRNAARNQIAPHDLRLPAVEQNLYPRVGELR